MKIENYKLKTSKKTKILIGSMVGIMALGGGYLLNRSLGKYQVEQSFPIMNGKIQVNSGDISIIAVNVDGKSVEVIPSKGEGKYFESAECDNEAIGLWDRTNWEFKIQNLTKKKTKCTLNFTTSKSTTTGEKSGASKMEDLLVQEGSNDDKLGSVVEDDYNNIRYIGQNPSNYIYFNCKNDGEQTKDSCEIWRIIGLMDNVKTVNNGTQRLLKIIREPLTDTSGKVKDLSWDSSNSRM